MPFITEPPQKPQAAPEDVLLLLRKTDPAQQLLRTTFFIGTELENIARVFDYAWIYPQLSQDIKSGLLKPENVYFYGQTEPIFYKGEQIFVPILICVIAEEKLPFQLSLTSVQAENEDILPLSKLSLEFAQHQIYFSVKTGSRKKNLYNFINILKFNGRFSTVKAELLNSYTYSNLYLPVVENVKRSIKQAEAFENCDISFKYLSTDVKVCVSVTEDLKEQAKMIFLKYIQQRKMDEIDIDAEKVEDQTISDLCLIFEREIEKGRALHQKKLDELENELQEANRLSSAFSKAKFIKYYPIDADEEIFVKTSGFVNRYFGTVSDVRQ